MSLWSQAASLYQIKLRVRLSVGKFGMLKKKKR